MKSDDRTKLEYIQRDIQKIWDEYVTRMEFELKISPLEKLVYGTVGLILVTVVGAVFTLVIK